jgi:hypothetical protein
MENRWVIVSAQPKLNKRHTALIESAPLNVTVCVKQMNKTICSTAITHVIIDEIGDIDESIYRTV